MAGGVVGAQWRGRDGSRASRRGTSGELLFLMTPGALIVLNCHALFTFCGRATPDARERIPTTARAADPLPLPAQRGNITDPSGDQREDHATPEQAGSNISGAIAG